LIYIYYSRWCLTLPILVEGRGMKYFLAFIFLVFTYPFWVPLPYCLYKMFTNPSWGFLFSLVFAFVIFKVLVEELGKFLSNKSE
jgi:hypothetical protein